MWQHLLHIPAFSIKTSVPPSPRAYEIFSFTHNYTPQQRRAAIALHEQRLLSVIIGLSTVLLTYAAARTLRVGESVAVSMSLFAALLPKALVVNAAVSNDAPVIALCSLGLVCFLQAERARVDGDAKQRRTWVIGLGLTLGVAAITKSNSLPVAGFLFALLALPAIWLRLQLRRGWGDGASVTRERVRSLFWDFALAVGAFSAVSGWWFIRNERLYGSFLASGAAERNVSFLTQGRYRPINSLGHLLFNVIPHQLIHTSWYDAFGADQLSLPGYANNLLALMGGTAIVRFPKESRHPISRLESRLKGCHRGSNQKEVHPGVQNRGSASRHRHRKIGSRRCPRAVGLRELLEQMGA